MGSGNPVKKITEGAKDLYGSVKDDPLGVLTSTIGSQIIQGADVASLTQQTGTRIRDDQRDQAAGMAQSEMDKAAAAERRAVDASVKDLDPIALERRRRAAVATNQGRSGTILTAGQSLGSADVARKTLLGM